MKIFKKILRTKYSLTKLLYQSLSHQQKEKLLEKSTVKEKLPPIADHPAQIQSVEGKDYFCILSWGACGSVWIGNILSDHPDITCGVGNDHPVTAVSYSDPEKSSQAINKILDEINAPSDVKYGANFVSDGQFIADLNVENHRKYLNSVSYGAGNIIKNSLKKRGLEFDIPNRFSMTANFPFFFKELEMFFPKSSFYGNIHGMTCEHAAALAKSNPNFLQQVVLVDLIRHPITRLESIINGRRLLYKLDLLERKNIDDSILQKPEQRIALEKKFKVDFDNPENRIRFYCNYSFLGKGWNKLCADDIRSFNVQRVLFERIKNEPDYLAWLISYLTKGKVSVSKSYLDSIYNNKEVFENSGRMGEIKIAQKSARDQWEEWPEWQKEVFYQQCNEYDLYDLYAEFCYDLSFVKHRE